MSGSFHKTILTSAILSLPLLAWLAIQARTNTDDHNNWIDKSSAEYATYQLFADRFGNGDDILVSWDGCTSDDERLERVADDIRLKCESCIDGVVTGGEALQRLKASASRFSENSSRRRLRGSLFGDDLKTTCIVVTVNPHGRAHLADLIGRVEQTVTTVAGIEREQVHLAGKAVSDHALNAHTNRALWWGIPGALLAALVALLCIQDWRLTSGMVFVSALSGLASLAAVPLFGVQVNGLLVLMPVLVFVLTLGCAVHMVRSLQRTTVSENVSDRIQSSLALSRTPVILSMTTTAIGIGSLAASPIQAVFQFGLFSAGSLLFALLLLLFLLPATWYCQGQSNRPAPTGSADPASRILLGVFRHPWLAIILMLALAAPAVRGISRFETDLNTHTLFAPETRFSVDHDWMEQHLYPLGRVDLMIGFPKKLRSNRFQQLQTIRKLSTAVRGDASYHSALSVANFVRIPRSSSSLQRQLTEQLISSQIEYDYPQLHAEGMLFSDEQTDYWRVSVACRIDEKNDERANADRMQELARMSLEDNPGEIDVVATGMGPLAASGQRRLFRDLVRGLGTALIVITLLIVVSLRSLRLGLLAIIPNVFPILIVFGYFGLFGRKLDIGAILTASVGLGIAIDDTVHFLHYYRLGLLQQSGVTNNIQRSEAIRYAIRRCANPIITTTTIVLCGLAPFIFSSFLPVRHFSVCLILMMAVAAIADLVLLPALMNLRTATSQPKIDPAY